MEGVMHGCAIPLPKRSIQCLGIKQHGPKPSSIHRKCSTDRQLAWILLVGGAEAIVEFALARCELTRCPEEEREWLMQDRNPGIRLGAARLVCESYSAIAKAAEEKEMLIKMEARMEQLQANMQTAQPILDAEDADFKELPPAA